MLVKHQAEDLNSFPGGGKQTNLRSFISEKRANNVYHALP